ncbi:MAG: hypothetical protein K0S33_12 [Bacteroidetes bacterium]|jgi:hypothetical protein|nr:hypothetical protein [Bacteroidota bacterium]
MFNLNNNKVFFPVLIIFSGLIIFLGFVLFSGKTISSAILSDFKSLPDSISAGDFSEPVNPRTGLKEYAVRSVTLTPGAVLRKDSLLFEKWNKSNYDSYMITAKVDSIISELEKDTLAVAYILDKSLNTLKLKQSIENYIISSNEIRHKIEAEKIGVNYFAGYSNTRPWPVYFFNGKSVEAVKDSLIQIKEDISSMQMDTDIKVNDFATH